MARLKVNMTRMEMRNLKDKLKIAERGYDLLKEKQDSMVKEYMRFYEKARILRRETEQQFAEVYESVKRSSIQISEDVLEKSLMITDNELSVDARVENVVGVKTPKFRVNEYHFELNDYSLFALDSNIDKVALGNKDLITNLVHLAEVEKACLILAKEIKETRRRVNALKHRKIPDLIETIKYINMKIDDNERSQKARVMKINN